MLSNELSLCFLISIYYCMFETNNCQGDLFCRLISQLVLSPHHRLMPRLMKVFKDQKLSSDFTNIGFWWI